MGKFDRGLDNTFIRTLNEEYDKDGWWRAFVDDPELFLAIRHGRVNVYYRGCSLLKWEAGAPNWEIHYKYLLRPNMDDLYVKVDGGQPILRDDVKGFFIENLADLESLKKAARPYAGDEKTGVHDVIRANENVLDVEIQLGRDRIDFVALQETDRGIDLVFFEAKHFSNRELRSKGAPKVVKQIKRYASMLRDNCQAIRDSYCRVCNNLMDLPKLAERYPRRHKLMKRIVDRPQELFLDKNPRLIVFGFDEDQKDGSNWEPHRQKLKHELGDERVLLRGRSKGFRKGISTGY